MQHRCRSAPDIEPVIASSIEITFLNRPSIHPLSTASAIFMMIQSISADVHALFLAIVVWTLGATNGQAAIAQRGATTTATATSTTLTIPKPTGVVAGDVMLATLACYGTVATVQTTPVCAGWTLVKSGNLRTSTHYPYGAVLYRVADGTEGSNFAFALGTGTANAVGDIVAFSGVDATGGVDPAGTAASGPFDVTPGIYQANTSGSKSLTPAAITTASANAAVILCGMSGGTSSVVWGPWATGTPGFLTLAEVSDHATTNASVGAAWATKAAIGSTGAGSVTVTSSRNGGLLLALKPVVVTVDLSGDLASALDTLVGVGNTGRLIANTKTLWDPTTAASNVILNGFQFTIYNGGGNAQTYNGALTGPGTLRFQGRGDADWSPDIQLGGTLANSPAGVTFDYGRVQLNKAAGVDALAGALTVNTANTVRIQWLKSDQINDASTLTSTASSGAFYLDMGGFSDTISGLVIKTGHYVNTGTGGVLKVTTLTVGGVSKPKGAYNASSGFVTGSGYIDVDNFGPPVVVNPPGVLASPAPADAASSVNPATLTQLTWAVATEATSYDVYLWLASATKPVTPIAMDLALNQYMLTADVLSLENYQWQIVAKNSVGNTAGPIWTFATIDRRNISGALTQGLDAVVGAGPARLTANATSYWGATTAAASVNLNGFQFTINNGGGNSQTYNGAITGPGTLRLQGRDDATWYPDIQLGGTLANSPDGVTLEGGRVQLNKTDGVDALAGTIAVNTDAVVRIQLLKSNQISDSAILTTTAGTGAFYLEMNGFSDTLLGLTMKTEHQVDTGAGGVLTVSFLTVNGAVIPVGSYTSTSSFVTGTGSVIVLGVTPAASASLSTVTATPSEVVADGSTAATVTVTLLDSSGNPATGKTVKLTSNRSALDTISAASGVSNAFGVVTFSVTSVTAGVPLFTARDLTDSNLLITATATMTFTPGPPTVKVTNLVNDQVLRYSMVLVDGTFDGGSTLTVTAVPSSAGLSLTKCANRFRCLVDLQPGTNTLTFTDSHDPVTLTLVFTPPTATDYRYKIWYVVPSDEANTPVDPDYAIHFGLQTKLMQSWMAEDQMRAGNGRLTFYPLLLDGTNTVDVGKLVVTQTRAEANALNTGMYNQVWNQLPALYKDGRHKNLAFSSVAFNAFGGGDLSYVGAYQNIFPNSSAEMMAKLLSTASYGSDSLTFATYSGVTLHEIIHGIHSIWHDFSSNNIMGGAYDISQYFTLTYNASNPSPHNETGAGTLGVQRDLASWNRYLMSADPHVYQTTAVGITAGPEYLTATSAYPLAVFQYYLPSTATDLHVNLSGAPATTYSKHAGRARMELGSNPFNIMAVDIEGNMSYTTFTAATVPVVPVDDGYTVSDGAAVIAAPGVLANDINPSSSTLTAARVTDVQHGALVLSSNGGFSYTPTPGYAGTDTFTYRVSDGVSSDQTALVTLTMPPAVVPPFDIWAGTGDGGNGLIGAAAAFDADPDNDRLPNGIEFVLGGQPNPARAGSNSHSLLPTVQASGNNVVFTFLRRDDAAYLNPVVEFTTDLSGPWTTARAGNATIAVLDGTPADTVTVTIPKGLNPRLFARLKVGTGAVTGGIPPRLTTAPVDTTVTSGWDLSLSTTAEGTQPLTVQWYLNGSIITGATDHSYTVTGAGSANQGDYQVVVTNAYGTATSSTVHVTMSAPTGSADLNFIPSPLSVQTGSGVLTIPTGARIVATDASLVNAANVLATEITAVHARTLPVVTTAAVDGDIVLALDAALTGERHTLIVGTRVTVRGSNAFGVSLGTATLLQALRAETGALGCPRVTIDDTPAVAIRALHLDLARKNHSYESLLQAVDLCRLYKVNYLHLHFNDDQGYTFPSTAYPLLNTTTISLGHLVYTLAQMQSLEAYAVARGVHIMPELEGPGHNALMLAAYPDLFRITYPITEIAKYVPSSSVNIAKAEVRAAWRTLIGEMCAVFQSTPYFHLGCDEVDWAWSEYNTDFQAAFVEWGFNRSTPRQNVSLVFSKFITLARDYAAEFGKKSIVWENSDMNGAPEVPPPTDILVMPFDCYNPIKFTTYGTGMKLVNAAWSPLYAVNEFKKKVSAIYAWNRTLFGPYSGVSETYSSYTVPAQHVLGTQFTTFEQEEDLEMMSVRARLAATSERTWNPDLGSTYDHFRLRLTHTDAVLDALLSPVCVSFTGLTDVDDRVFTSAATVSMRLSSGYAGQPLTIRYTTSALGTANGANVINTSTLYTGPFQVTTDGVLRAAAFNASGQRVGRMVREYYRH